jgi:hypothetical protein
MERDLAGAALSAEDFQRLAKACRHDRKFPNTYEAWRSLVAAGTAHVLAQGQDVEVVGIAVDDFLIWCKRVQVVPCFDALRAYMIVLRRTERDGKKANGTPVKVAGNDKTPDGSHEAVGVDRGSARAVLGSVGGSDHARRSMFGGASQRS